MVMENGKRKNRDYSKFNVVSIVKNICESSDIHASLRRAAAQHDIPAATLETWVLKFKVYGEKYFTERDERRSAAYKAITNPSLLKRIIRLEKHLNLTDSNPLS